MNWIFKRTRLAYDKKISSYGMSIFRIAIGIIILFEVIGLYRYKHLIFDNIPYVEPYEIDFSIPLIIWMFVSVSIIIGLFTRLNTIINYIFLLAFISSIKSYEYHMFYAYMGIGFVMMFLPLNKSLSIDRIILRIKYTNAKHTYVPTTKISSVYYYIPVFVVIGLVYFDSVFFKFTSYYWLNGLGMWEPAVLPQFNHYGDTFILNNEFISKAMGYITLIFETIFIFLFWYKPFRIPFFILGIGLHVGILLFFPIPLFALGVSGVYLLLIPVGFWQKLGTFFIAKNKGMTFIYDADCPLCNRTKVLISSVDMFNRISFVTAQSVKQNTEIGKHFATIDDTDLLLDIYSINKQGKIHKGVDTYISVLYNMRYTAPFALILQIPGIYHIGKYVYRKVAENRERVPCTDESCSIELPDFPVDKNETKLFTNLTLKDVKVKLIALFFICITTIQIVVSYESGIIKIVRTKTGFSNTSIDKFLENKSKLTQHFSKKLLGITNHPVFMDGHMNGYNHIIAVTHKQGNKEVWLPIIDKNGQPGQYIYGPRWVKWTFRVNGPYVNEQNLRKGLRDFSAFWLGQNHKPFNNQTFIIKVKKIIIPKKFIPGIFEKQISGHWINAGTFTWNNNKFEINIPKPVESL